MLISTIILILILRKLRRNSTNWKKINLTLLPIGESYSKKINTIKLRKNIIEY
jgi:hypothetical protein